MRPMSDTQLVQSSLVSIRSSDFNIEDAFKKMKVNDDGVAESNPYPDRPGEKDCQFYLRTGLCGYGSSCRYNHPTNLPQGNNAYYKEALPERIGQPDCEYFLKTGACKYGSTCKYHHPKDRNGAEPVLFNVIGLPMRQGEKPCPYYLRTGTCRFGVACRFHHPQPDNGHSTAYGMPSLPSTGLQYASGLTMMSTYGTLPRPQVPQSYVPIMISPSQGLFPPQGWGTYMAAPNPMYNVKNQPYYSGSSASVPVAMALNRGLPESSDRPECRFFMNTGTCKYGDDCKYNHPGVRISPPPPSLINPFVLPARPGQPACGNFRSYGFCKFGPNCKFDHPVLPYPGLTMSSSLATPYASPVLTHHRISPPPSRSDSKSLSNGKPDYDSEQLNNSEVHDLSEKSSST
ncbi:PREDICTED: zinc finger CCCH domain-containing protein 3-like isoform X1 [Camelina sativa]|uniref:Zinc finger CCCH domain-containing protein 3-like isoform X1 n=1 Tax=Camelina sativa TaxID=90675 RepID=A0ABM0XE03_CAMSA|nr:PREDICTED: zinc finger CCCH domain-containing protein 3-like isoform X1 [Camelina sativa]